MLYISLFFVSFASATLLPGGSEALLISYYLIGLDPVLLLLFAGSGNTMGSMLNYYIGKKGSEYLIKNNKVSPNLLKKSKTLFNRYGGFILLFSWMPIIGDPLTLFAGVVKYNPLLTVIIIAISKFGRYGAILYFM